MDFSIGYKALRETAAVLDLSTRGEIIARGDDRARLLHAMTTNHVQQLKPGEGLYAFFLNAQGRILGDVNLFCLEEYFLLDVEPETKQRLYEHLDRYIIADDVTLEYAPLAAIGVEGPEAHRALSNLGAPLPAEPYAIAEWGERLIAQVSATGQPGWRVFAPDREALIESLGLAEAPAEAWRVVRLERHKARYGEDVSERYLAQETQLMHALHFNKGCYLGQEIVERVRSRATIHRVLVPLELDATDAPSPGTKLANAEGKDVAEITSAAYSPARGKVVGLAYARVDFACPGTELRFGDVRAVVTGERPL